MRTYSANLGRRALLKSLVSLAGLGAGSRLFSVSPFPQYASAQTKTESKKDEEPNRGSVLVLLGTEGGPQITLTRGETASVLVVDGQLYLIDCGYGTLRALVQAGLDRAPSGSCHPERQRGICFLLVPRCY